MNRLPKVSLAAFAACALALGACGSDSDNDEPSEVTTVEATDAATEATDAPADDTVAESEEDTSDTGDTGDIPAEAKDIAIGMFEDMGLSTDQATCLVDKLGIEEMAAGESPDMTAVMEYLEDCDIDPADLSGG